MSAIEQVRATLEPLMAPLGLVLEDVSVSPAGRRRIVRVVVDTDLTGLDPDDTTSVITPLSLDEIADATRAISDALDASVALGEAPYLLEVSSPGVGRPLTTREDFRRNVGRLVEVRHGDASSTGRLLEVATDRLVLERPATKRAPAGTVSLDLGQVARGTVQVEFSRPDTDDSAIANGDPSDAEEEN